MSLQVELVSPERILWSGEAEMVITRTLGGGDIAFLTGHAPFVGALGIGVLTIRPAGGGADELIAVHGGFVEISNNKVSVLSDVSELSGQIDVDRARAAKATATKALGGDDDAELEAAIRRADVRLEAAGVGVAAA